MQYDPYPFDKSKDTSESSIKEFLDIEVKKDTFQEKLAALDFGSGAIDLEKADKYLDYLQTLVRDVSGMAIISFPVNPAKRIESHRKIDLTQILLLKDIYGTVMAAKVKFMDAKLDDQVAECEEIVSLLVFRIGTNISEYAQENIDLGPKFKSFMGKLKSELDAIAKSVSKGGEAEYLKAMREYNYYWYKSFFEWFKKLPEVEIEAIFENILLTKEVQEKMKLLNSN